MLVTHRCMYTSTGPPIDLPTQIYHDTQCIIWYLTNFLGASIYILAIVMLTPPTPPPPSPHPHKVCNSYTCASH